VFVSQCSNSVRRTSMWRITHNIWLYTHSFERCPAYTAPPEEVLAEGWAK
jgi:hypothetical protein